MGVEEQDVDEEEREVAAFLFGEEEVGGHVDETGGGKFDPRNLSSA